MGRGKGVPGGRLDQGLDKSWMRWTRCKVCGRKICVNNYEDHVVRPVRIKGVVVCPWCTEPAVDLYLIAKGLTTLASAAPEERKTKLKTLLAKAQERLHG